MSPAQESAQMAARALSTVDMAHRRIVASEVERWADDVRWYGLTAVTFHRATYAMWVERGLCR